MEINKIAGIVLKMVGKGYADYEVIKDSDDMYDATDEDKYQCDNLLDELLETGTSNFSEKYGLV